MKPKAIFLAVYKLFFALLALSAILTELVVAVGRNVFNPANFFSFFTIQTNLIITIVLVLSAIAVISGKSGRWLDILRGSATVYILVVGIGFAVLLAGLSDIMLTAVPWDNTVLHYIIPVAVLVDFIIDRPKKIIRFAAGLPWLVYPLLYAAYSLIRGAVVGWYPYPFLNPAAKGYGEVAITVGGLLVLGVVLIWMVTWVSGWKNLGKTKVAKRSAP